MHVEPNWNVCSNHLHKNIAHGLWPYDQHCKITSALHSERFIWYVHPDGLHFVSERDKCLKTNFYERRNRKKEELKKSESPPMAKVLQQIIDGTTKISDDRKTQLKSLAKDLLQIQETLCLQPVIRKVKYLFFFIFTDMRNITYLGVCKVKYYADIYHMMNNHAPLWIHVKIHTGLIVPI